MNIFILDLDPRRAAAYHCDKHCVKMIVESAQLLCIAHHALGSATPSMYKATHSNHPSAVWARTSIENYRWLHQLTFWLCKEYTHRYSKIHKVEWSGLLTELEKAPPVMKKELTPFAQAMPIEYRGEDAVEAYRLLYAAEKLRFSKWTNRPMPAWLQSFGFKEFVWNS